MPTKVPAPGQPETGFSDVNTTGGKTLTNPAGQPPKQKPSGSPDKK